MNIFAIIVTYNGMTNRWIEKCLNSLQDSTVAVKAIVIDNNSQDGTREYVPQNFPEVVWFPQTQNLGFGQANNLGIKYAMEHKADYVLLLNQDATISNDAIEKMLAFSDGQSLLCPLHLNGDGSNIDEMVRISLKIKDTHFLYDLLVRHSQADSYETGEICAACWLMPKQLLEKIGGFNPLFFHYSEDNNYYQRMVFHQVKTLLIPAARMYHDRALQGNIQAYNRKLLQRNLLLEACNINHSFGKCCFNWIKLLHRSHYPLITFMKEMLWIIKHAGAIRRSRATEKKEGAHWL